MCEGWTQVALILLNVLATCFFVVSDQFNEVKNIRDNFWRLLSIPITTIYLVETVVVLRQSSFSQIVLARKLYALEFLLQTVSVFAYVKIYSDESEEQYALGSSMLLLAFLMRNLRVTILFEEVHSFKVIVSMVMKLTIPVMNQLAAIYVVFFIFAQVGMFGLGGLVREPSFHSELGVPNNLYYLMNFNDLGMSIHTLFAFMMQRNNWPSLTDTLVSASGQQWPHLYFMVFYILLHWIMFNVVVSVILDCYTRCEDETANQFRKLNNIKALMAFKRKLGAPRFEQLCDRVNRRLLMQEIEKNQLLDLPSITQTSTLGLP